MQQSQPKASLIRVESLNLDAHERESDGDTAPSLSTKARVASKVEVALALVLAVTSNSPLNSSHLGVTGMRSSSNKLPCRVCDSGGSGSDGVWKIVVSMNVEWKKDCTSIVWYAAAPLLAKFTCIWALAAW